MILHCPNCDEHRRHDERFPSDAPPESLVRITELVCAECGNVTRSEKTNLYSSLGMKVWFLIVLIATVGALPVFGVAVVVGGFYNPWLALILIPVGLFMTAFGLMWWLVGAGTVVDIFKNIAGRGNSRK